MALRARSGLRLALLLLPGLAVRVALAPYTAGSDLAQFAGFADTMLRHKLKFFSFSDASKAAEEGWPYGWPYVYGPLLALILAGVRLVVKSPVRAYWEDGVYKVVIPNDWAAAVKMVFIAFDTLAAVLLYKLVKRLGLGEGRALAAALLYYYNPMVAYISSIYGMFDQIALALAVAGLYLYVSHRTRLGILILGLSASVKPTMAVVALPLLVHAAASSRSPGRAALLAALLILGAAGPYLPFALADPEGLRVYIKAVSMVSSPSYASNVQYSFNGLSSIAFYAWFHGDEAPARTVLKAWVLLFAPLYTLLLAGSPRRDPVASASLAYVTFAATYWRVNPQYIAPLVAFLALLRERAGSGRARALSSLAMVISGLWPLIFPVSFWAHVHIENSSDLVIRILSHVSLNVPHALYYIYYSLTLTVTLLLIVMEGLAPEIRGMRLWAAKKAWRALVRRLSGL